MNRAWSFSRLKAFEQCPKKFYHLKVVKDYSEPETEAMTYGTEFHEAAEFYVRDGAPLPAHFEFAKELLDSLNNIEGEKLCEYEMGLTENLTPCGFKADDVWFRGIADLLILNRDKKRAFVVDYKTGRNAKYADRGQLELMALCVFKHFPEIEEVRAGLLFVITGDLIKETYTIKDEPKLWRKWLANYTGMEKAYERDVWNARPTGLCKRHCVVTQCPHNGRN